MSRTTDSVPELLRECLACHNRDAQALAYDLLARNGYAPETGDRYVYGAGTVPILMVAHTDTVHKAPPAVLYHDSALRVVWAPGGLGADDRAGMYGVAWLLAQGLRPHVLFTDEEEIGGRGAESAALSLPAPPVRLMIQLDRRGADDAVYYNCDNKAQRRWVNRHGFRTAQGTFTDISVLMPEWGIAGVNLSVGYYNEHTKVEHLKLGELEATLGKVARMLRKPPRRPFAFSDRWPRLDEAVDKNRYAETTDEEFARLWAEQEDRDFLRWK